MVVPRNSAGPNAVVNLPERVRLLALRDSAEIMAMAKDGLTTYLKPMLELKKVQVPPLPEYASTAGVLSIKPVLYSVDCGAMALICQVSVLFDVNLIDREFSRTEWSAQFKVGAPMGAKQDQKVAENMFSSMVEKLVAAKLISR